MAEGINLGRFCSSLTSVKVEEGGFRRSFFPPCICLSDSVTIGLQAALRALVFGAVTFELREGQGKK